MSHVPRYPESEASWDQHRKAITQLYYCDGLSLRQLMMKMSKLHGLKATVKMYKTRIKAWGLTKYTRRGRKPHHPHASSLKLALRAAAPGCEPWMSNFCSSDEAETVPCDMIDAPTLGIGVPGNRLPLTIGFDQQIDHFLRATMIYLQFADGRESWRSMPSLLAPQKSQAAYKDLAGEWEVNVFDRTRYGLDCIFFSDIMTSICYAARANYHKAGECWRSAFRSIETAIDREDPELLVALMWSVTLLSQVGCGDVVIILQDYLLRLVGLRAHRSHPLFPVLAKFAKMHPTTMVMLRVVVLNIIINWATAISREDVSLYKIYYWSLFPSADGFLRIASTGFTDLKNVVNRNTDPVGSDRNGYVSERFIFLARRKRGLGSLPGDEAVETEHLLGSGT